ncbi:MULTISPECIES: integrase arm-type DNA-binding domain-containing protein [unclassified Desulfovibrio]|uniref:tyrosine-type recombinase/integrase n=1 Tax=unclassified Desulfovibrio TaxID=2593640 RepID=UPI0013EDFAEB|nr:MULTISPECIES: integrase arm-type DNA-binding domain-containing protein [unclassified Desulfovibrio]
MPRPENLLTSTQIKAALKKGEPVKLRDGGGLFFSVSEKNKGIWFVRGRLNGVPKKRVLGHEDMTLAEARTLKIEEKKLLKAGVDSIAEKKALWKKTEYEERTFGMIAQEWLEFWKNDKDDKTIQSTIGRMNKHILPSLGKIPYSKLNFTDLKNTCLKIANSGHREMANRVGTIINQVCRFAKINGYHQYNIAEDLPRLFPKPKRDINFEGFPAITDKVGVAEMLQKITKYVELGKCSPHMGAALLLFPKVPLRASSMLMSEWKDINFETMEWRIPAEHMKGEIGKRKDFIIPLSKQVYEILLNLSNFSISKYVFPSGRKSGHLSIEGVNKSLHMAGIPKGKMCIHGWRKVWGSLAREYGLPDKLVERGLAHSSGSAVENAYNRAQYKEVMRYVFQWWCDTLDALEKNDKVPPLVLKTEIAYS